MMSSAVMAAVANRSLRRGEGGTGGGVECLLPSTGKGTVARSGVVEGPRRGATR
jgi:hypothetical protein